MASHSSDANSTAALWLRLNELSLASETGIDAARSAHGIPYRTLRAIGKDATTLMAWAVSLFEGAIEDGATSIVWRESPSMTTYENNRKFQKGIVLKFHLLPDGCNAHLPKDTEGGPALKIGPQVEP